MFTEIVRAPPSAIAPARSNAALIESRLSKFRAAVQPRVRALAAEHKWVADLALSFPAVLFALAVPHRAESAATALRLVVSGAPLATVAQSAGVPLWLRSFPAEAFETAIAPLPDTPDFRRRIANHLPKNWRVAPDWLKHVAKAAETADDDIALWFARETPTKERRSKSYKRRRVQQHRRLVALWAWYSTHVDPADSYIALPWRSEMQWNAAKDAALQWLDALFLPLFVGGSGVADTWLEDGEVDGYTFTALRTGLELQAESAAMNHCVARYGQDLADNYVRVWSVRRDGERVATLSLRSEFGSLPQIRELAGPANAVVPIDMHIAARRWLYSQDTPNVDLKRFETKSGAMDSVFWRQLWRRYWLAKKRIPQWLPLQPSIGALYAL